MLTRAHELQRRDVDVVVAAVDTHHSKALDELLVPLAHVGRDSLRNVLDLDGVLRRRPQVAVVDDMAHLNPHGARHEHRWQDINELLAAGIDVLTAVNVYHLESLNDVVERIIGLRILATVPKTLFDQLHDIRLVDLPARELIERLGRGEVNLPDAVKVSAFFKPSHLMALRELALQTVAQHVDAELRERRHDVGQQDSIQRHVLVAIDGRGQSEHLVRAGYRIAQRRGVPWSVVTVKAGAERIDSAARRRFLWHRHSRQARLLEIDRGFALAQSLGGSTAVLHGADTVTTLLDAATARHARTIVIGRMRCRLRLAPGRSLTQQLLQRGTRFELTIASVPRARRGVRPLRPPSWSVRKPLLLAGGMLAAVGIALAGHLWLNLADISMVLMLALLLVASRPRTTIALLMAAVCFLTYNLVSFASPAPFNMEDPRSVATVSVVLATALIAGRLASRQRSQLFEALEAARAGAETDRLRAALLSSVSHDLRSPLSAMIGAAESLLHYGHAMNKEDCRSLLEMVKAEGERLDRYIQNLLDMTRLGQSGLTLSRDWIGIDELIGAAVRRLQRYVPNARVSTYLPGALPPVQVHLALLTQAIFNVMENAAKFSPDAAIQLQVDRTATGWLRIDISDAGPGIPEDERHRIFDMFYSVEHGDRGHHGTGLGLTIVQGIIKAHEGCVEALPGPNGQGTTIRMTLPWRAAAQQEEHHVEDHP